ncbi:MAG: hypothetical protein GY711_12710 [bacterium]|nr:hypothetical protein [bacterium]
MKHFNKLIKKKGERLIAARVVLSGALGALCVALCGVTVVTLAEVARGDGNMAGGDTGTLPVTEPGDPLDADLLDQAFYLMGDRQVLRSAIYSMTGSGTVRTWDISPTESYMEIYGDAQLVLRENVLRESRMDMGVVPGFMGGGMLAALEVDGTMTPTVVVPNIGRLDLPYVRMSNANLFSAPLTLHTMQGTGERGRLEITGGSGFLTINQYVAPVGN